MIHIPYWWHATLFEVLWLSGGLAAAWITGLNLLDSWKDRQALDEIRADQSVHDRHYRMIELAAKGRTASQAFRLAISGLIVVAGIQGCVTANPLRGATTLTGFFVTVCLDGIALITAWRAFADLRERNRLYELATGRSAVLAARMAARGNADL